MKLLLGILLFAGAVFCQSPRQGGNSYHARGSPKTTLKYVASSFKSQSSGTTSQDPLAELVNALTPILKTLAPVLKSLAPALKKLGPVLESLLSSLLPQNGTAGAQPNPLGSLVNNLLTKPNPIGNLVGGLLGKPAGTPLIDTVGSVVGGLTGATNPSTKPTGNTGPSVLSSVGSLVENIAGQASSANVPPVSSVLGGVLGGNSKPVPSPRKPVRRSFPRTVGPAVSRVGGILGGVGPSSPVVYRPVPSSQADPRNMLHKRMAGNTQTGNLAESCESSCPYRNEPVCSMSGSTYRNACMLQCSGETFSCNGECPCRERIAKPHRCPCDPYQYDPVCTIEGEQIINRCLAICKHKVIACSSHCPC